jgi:hypothetical protein
MQVLPRSTERNEPTHLRPFNRPLVDATESSSTSTEPSSRQIRPKAGSSARPKSRGRTRMRRRRAQRRRRALGRIGTLDGRTRRSLRSDLGRVRTRSTTTTLSLPGSTVSPAISHLTLASVDTPGCISKLMHSSCCIVFRHIFSHAT